MDHCSTFLLLSKWPTVGKEVIIVRGCLNKMGEQSVSEKREKGVNIFSLMFY